MDDFNPVTLRQSKCEWAARLCNLLVPRMAEGFQSILDEAIRICKENKEPNKYLMTFQNLVHRVPKWNAQIIEKEKQRILKQSGCHYLEDLVTCVHILQLKLLTAVRVGQKQKKISLDIPKLDRFLHQCYIHAARTLYKNVYLFEQHIAPLTIQKNRREMEYILQEAIMNTLRESIPIEDLIKQYLDETLEEEVVEEVHEQIVEKPVPTTPATAPPPPSLPIQANPSLLADTIEPMDHVEEPSQPSIDVPSNPIFTDTTPQPPPTLSQFPALVSNDDAMIALDDFQDLPLSNEEFPELKF